MSLEKATKAIQRTVRVHAGTGKPLTPTEMFDIWFPPSRWGFTEPEARTALSDLLHNGQIVMDEERHLTAGGDERG